MLKLHLKYILFKVLYVYSFSIWSSTIPIPFFLLCIYFSFWPEFPLPLLFSFPHSSPHLYGVGGPGSNWPGTNKWHFFQHLCTTYSIKHSTSVLFRKMQTSNGNQQIKAYQVVLRLSTFLSWLDKEIQCEEYGPKSGKKSVSVPAALVRKPMRASSYISVTDMNNSYVSNVEAHQLVVHSLWAPMHPD